MRSAVSVYPINPVGLCLIPWQADQSNETNQNRQLMHHVLCQLGDKRCSTDNCTKIFAQNTCWVSNSKVKVQMISRPVADHSSVCQGSRSPPTISPTPWKPLFPFVTFFFVSLPLICHSPALPITYCLAFWRWLFSLARKPFVRDLMSPALSSNLRTDRSNYF